MQRIDLKALEKPELELLLSENGFQRFRAAQILDWLKKGAKTASDFKNLPAELKNFIETRCYISVAIIEKKQISRYDNTVKYLFSFSDGECVESVVMRYRHGLSVCVSTQVGCRMGCAFCATGQGGLSRNLTASEILAQIEAAQEDLGERISNVVLMGMGEPLDNFDNVVRFIRLVTSEQSLNIGARHITLSTYGLVPRIYELADLKLQINLAVSLHAPNDLIRAQTMPVARAYSMDSLLRACGDYFERTGRRVTFEYAMISGVNDSDNCARELGEKLSPLHCHVNLIPVNSVEGTGYDKSNIKRQQSFVKILTAHGVAATVRRTLGSDIDASCGQLRRKHINEGGK